jgi:hypothetical protein
LIHFHCSILRGNGSQAMEAIRSWMLENAEEAIFHRQAQ